MVTALSPFFLKYQTVVHTASLSHLKSTHGASVLRHTCYNVRPCSPSSGVTTLHTPFGPPVIKVCFEQKTLE